MKILVINIESSIRKTIVTILKTHSVKNKLYEAENIKHGLKLINAIKPKIIILDIDITEEEFDEFNQFKPKGIKLIFITSNKHYMKIGKKYNVHNFLLKPIDKDKLLSIYEKATNI